MDVIRQVICEALLTIYPSPYPSPSRWEGISLFASSLTLHLVVALILTRPLHREAPEGWLAGRDVNVLEIHIQRLRDAIAFDPAPPVRLAPSRNMSMILGHVLFELSVYRPDPLGALLVY